jgi:hypothetical protein
MYNYFTAWDGCLKLEHLAGKGKIKTYICADCTCFYVYQHRVLVFRRKANPCRPFCSQSHYWLIYAGSW